jgi:hypothetical protein
VSTLKSLWEAWTRVARKIGSFQARVLLSVFYSLILAPFALAVRWGSDPLAIKPGSPRGWRGRPEPRVPPLQQARSQS